LGVFWRFHWKKKQVGFSVARIFWGEGGGGGIFLLKIFAGNSRT